MRQKLLSCLILIMVLAQIGLAQHNSVHIIDHVHEISQNHDTDHNQNDPSDDCQIYHFTSSLHGLDGACALDLDFIPHKITGFYTDIFYAQNRATNYHSRAPPTLLI